MFSFPIRMSKAVVAWEQQLHAGRARVVADQRAQGHSPPANRSTAATR